MFICTHCNRECKNNNSLRNHERLCKSNPCRQVSWLESNIGNFKRSNQWISSKEIGESYILTPESRQKMSEKAKGRRHSEATKNRLSVIARSNGLGGHTSKKRMLFMKKDGTQVYLQSSYETAFASILEKLEIEWSRPSPLIWLDQAGVRHRYYPDFKVGNIYIDTKNDYLALKDLAKINAVMVQNNVDVRIVTKENITEEYIASLI